MIRRAYQPMTAAPTDRPICAVCGGVEMAVIWDSDLKAWCYWDEDSIDCIELVRGKMSGWREMF